MQSHDSRRNRTTSKNVWIYRIDMGTGTKQANLVGYDVEAADGHIGKFDKATTETSRQYLVVDTGFLDLRQETPDPRRHGDPRRPLPTARSTCR